MRTLLIVDDEEYIIQIMKQSLERTGYRILTANNGQQALTILDAEVPDVVITDIQMPKLDGRGLCNAIVERFPDNSPLVIIVTSVIDQDLRRWAEQLPHVRFMEKPMSLKEIGAVLENHFQDRGE